MFQFLWTRIQIIYIGPPIFACDESVYISDEVNTSRVCPDV